MRKISAEGAEQRLKSRVWLEYIHTEEKKMRISTQTDTLAGSYGDKEALRLIAEAGFDCVDFSLFKKLSYGEIVNGKFDGFLFEPKEKVLDYYRGIKAAADEYGIAFGQLHTPFPSLLPLRPELDEKLIYVQKLSLEIAAVLDCPYAIVHPICGNDLKPEGYFEANMRFYGELAPVAKELGVGICLENMFTSYPASGKLFGSSCSTPEETIRYIDTLNEKYDSVFSYCLDVGHAHICGKDPAEFVRKLGRRLTTLHVQDNNGVVDQHIIPYLGGIDWDSFCAALKETGYSGSFNFEADYFISKFPKELGGEAVKLTYSIGRYLVGKYEL